MGNFSTYFPSAGGGGSIPINGYFPFLLNTSTTGYDNATGLYTHPDGTFWLKTGNITTDPSGLYPYAAANATNWSRNIPGDIPINAGGPGRLCNITWDGTNFWGMFNLSGDVYKMDTNLLTTGVNWSTPNVSDGHSIAWDSANGTLWIADANKSGTSVTIREFTTAGVAARTLSFFVGNDFGMMCIDNGIMYLTRRTSAATTVNVVTFDTATLTQQSSFTLGAAANNAFRVLFHDGADSLWVGFSTTVYEVSVSTSTLTGRSFVGSFTLPSDTTLGPSGEMYLANNTNIQGLKNYSPTGATVGDGTAKTDTDTAQPLFVRIG